MLLVFPPAVRSPEPPLGIALLSAFLKGRGRPCRCLDLNLEGTLSLLSLEPEAAASDRRTSLSLRRRERNLEALRSPSTYGNFSGYVRAVSELSWALKAAGTQLAEEGRAFPSLPGLADYQEEGRTPLRRADLLAAAADCERSPYAEVFARRLEGEVPLSGDGIVGISLCFLSQALPAFALIGLLRKRFPAVRIALGGSLVSSWVALGALQEGDDLGGLVDCLLPGPGEVALSSWLGLEPPRRGEAFPPDFGDFRLDDYLSPARILPYALSTGCPWRRCSFCPEKAEGNPYRPLSPAEAEEGLAQIGQDFRPTLLHFTDSEISPASFRHLAERRPPAPWYGFARFGKELADPAFCRLLADSGCLMLQLGLESGDQAVLDAVGKGTELGVISRALDSLKEAGIGTYVYLLFGTPQEDRTAALRTRDFVAERADSIDFLNLAVFNMPVASPEAERYSTGPFYQGELSLYTEFEHPRGWNRPQVREFLSRDFEGEPRLRAIVRGNPPVFSSNHAPLFLERGRLALERDGRSPRRGPICGRPCAG